MSVSMTRRAYFEKFQRKFSSKFRHFKRIFFAEEPRYQQFEQQSFPKVVAQSYVGSKGDRKHSMTVTYTAEVATCRKFGCFLKLLFRWKGSIYKLVWMDLSVFLTIYYGLNALYRNFLDDEQKSTFEAVVHYCNSYGSLIPLSFVLGFYVSIVMERWWNQYLTIPWPDPVAVFVSAHVHGQDERGRVMRRTVMRYVCLCQAIVLRIISPRVTKRFPTLRNLVDAGLLLDNELAVIEAMDVAFPKHPKHWMPIVWAASIITRARKEGRIRDDFSVKTIIDELNKFRGMCGVLMYYNSISVPLVYTQVVTLAVYSYFLCNVMGQQWTTREDDTGYPNVIDKYFPVFTTLQFFFYMGWLKVAETLINPFGDDDDDFEVNWMIDRNLQVSYLIVDDMHHEHPELVKDQYWDEVFPNELPYGDDDMKREEPPDPSTAKLDYSKSVSALSAIKVVTSRAFAPRFQRDRGLDKGDSDAESRDQSVLAGGSSVFSTGEKVENKRSYSVSSRQDERTRQADEVAAPADEGVDAFDRLIAERDRERRERMKNKMARNIAFLPSTLDRSQSPNKSDAAKDAVSRRQSRQSRASESSRSKKKSNSMDKGRQ